MTITGTSTARRTSPSARGGAVAVLAAGSSLVHDPVDSGSSLVRVFVLPHPDAGPPCVSEPAVRVTVSYPVGENLLRPERGVGRSDGVVLGAAVPEATVHEHSDSRRAEHHVRGAPDLRKWSR